MPLQFRRGTDAERQAMTTPLAPGEPLFVTTPGLEKLYIGDGQAMSGIPVTGYTNQNALDAVGNSLVDNNGSNQQITFSYNTLTGAITASVDIDRLYQDLDLSSNNIVGIGNIDIQGQIRGTFKGSLFGDDSTPLVDGISSSVLLNGTIKDDIVPANNFIVDIGSTTNRFKDIYLTENARIFLDDVIVRVDTGFLDVSGGMAIGDSLLIDGAEISSNGIAIDLPAGSTVNGYPIESISPGQNYNVNIVGDDSSIIVDSTTSTINAIEGNFRDLTGTLIGDVKGSLFSDDSGFVVNGMTREIFANEILCTGRVSTNDLEVTGTISGTYDNGSLIIVSNAISSETGAIEFTAASSGSQVIINFEAGQTAGDIFAATGVQRLDLRTIGGTFDSPEDLVAGDVLGNIGFVGYQSSTDTESISGIGIIVDGNGTVTSTHVPTKLFLYSQPATPGLPNLLTFDTRGYLAVGQENASATLDVNGFAKLAILSAPPGTPSNGMIAIADGDPSSGWDPIGLGLPAKQQMVVYLGGGWRQIAVEP